MLEYKGNPAAEALLRHFVSPTGQEVMLTPKEEAEQEIIAESIADVFRRKRMMALRAITPQKMEEAKLSEIIQVVNVLSDKIDKYESTHPKENSKQDNLTEDERLKIQSTVFRALNGGTDDDNKQPETEEDSVRE